MDKLTLMGTFVSVANCGSFADSARTLGVTRALVSKRVGDLEAHLGVKLFNRNTHSLHLTTIGSDYLRHCTPVLLEIERIEEEMVSKQKSARGELRILVSKTLGELVLAPLISAFCECHPEITIHVVLKDMTPTAGDLISGGYDCAIRTLPTANSELLVRSIARVRRVLVASPRYLESVGMPICPGDLKKHECLEPGGRSHNLWVFDGPGGQQSINISGKLRTNSSAVILHAAIRGLGIACLRDYVATKYLESGDIVRVLGGYSLEQTDVLLLYQRDHHIPERVRLFFDFLSARINQYL